MNKTVNLTIGELTLAALPCLSIQAIRSIVQQELSKLLAQGNMNKGLVSPKPTMLLDDIQLEVNPNDSTPAVSRELARLIYQGMQHAE